MEDLDRLAAVVGAQELAETGCMSDRWMSAFRAFVAAKVTAPASTWPRRHVHFIHSLAIWTTGLDTRTVEATTHLLEIRRESQRALLSAFAAGSHQTPAPSHAESRVFELLLGHDRMTVPPREWPPAREWSTELRRTLKILRDVEWPTRPEWPVRCVAALHYAGTALSWFHSLGPMAPLPTTPIPEWLTDLRTGLPDDVLAVLAGWHASHSSSPNDDATKRFPTHVPHQRIGEVLLADKDGTQYFAGRLR